MTDTISTDTLDLGTIADIQMALEAFDFSDDDALLDDFDALLNDGLEIGGDVLIETGHGTIALQNVSLDDILDS